MLDKHFEWIASCFSTVLPGEKLSGGPKVCLTFDDATCDFYHLIFPLLEKYRLKALLAVPTAFIPKKVALTPEERLKKVKELPSKIPPIPNPAFCSWEELRILAGSPLIQIASHSLHHRPLTSQHVNPAHELTLSKEILEEELNGPINTFVYPYGQWNRKVHTLAKQSYQYIFRIGNAHNISWNQNLLYRVSGDALISPTSPFDLRQRIQPTIRYFLNTLLKK
ncbi:MAG: polysaccharide deacetylase family protein [Chlamydiia bacterium]|nr:polysaccharide deacetylase family protein [Chlamydiia bacterium]